MRSLGARLPGSQAARAGMILFHDRAMGLDVFAQCVACGLIRQPSPRNTSVTDIRAQIRITGDGFHVDC